MCAYVNKWWSILCLFIFLFIYSSILSLFVFCMVTLYFILQKNHWLYLVSFLYFVLFTLFDSTIFDVLCDFHWFDFRWSKHWFSFMLLLLLLFAGLKTFDLFCWIINMRKMMHLNDRISTSLASFHRKIKYCWYSVACIVKSIEWILRALSLPRFRGYLLLRILYLFCFIWFGWISIQTVIQRGRISNQSTF